MDRSVLGNSGLWGPPLKVSGAEIAESRVTTVGIIEHFEELEDRRARLSLGAPLAGCDELTFEGGEEAFGQSVVVAVTRRAHRRNDARLMAALAEGEAGVLRSAIGVVHHPRTGA